MFKHPLHNMAATIHSKSKKIGADYFLANKKVSGQKRVNRYDKVLQKK